MDISVWRARIGSYNHGVGSRSGSGDWLCVHGTTSLLSFFLRVLVILLVIGNVEVNPGPALEKCRVCNYEAQTIGSHMQHQRLHASISNFRYVCPVISCHFTFTSYATFDAHVSSHEVARNEVTMPSYDEGLLCETCGTVQACVKTLCGHVINEHLKNGQSVQCPLRLKCSTTRLFKSATQLRPHLSMFHPGWSKDFGPAGGVGLSEGSEGQDADMNIIDDHNAAGSVDIDEAMSTQGSDNFSDSEDSEDSEDSDRSTEYGDVENFSSELVLVYIANFYAKLEGKLLVPASTVQKVSESLAFLSEVIQAKLKETLSRNLVELGLTEDKIDLVLKSLALNDVFYNVHHKTVYCESLSTVHLRYKYYKKHFQYVEPTEINLKRRDPNDRSATIQYIPVKDTLEVMLADPSVQLQIDKSFVSVNNRDPEVVRDYTDGLVFKKRNLPPKRIDLILYQDSFNGAKNSLGSAKDKYKTLGVYMTLGNLEPFIRSQLKAKRLAMLALESLTKDENLINGLRKCFKTLNKDLQSLEKNGIMYKGEIVPVFVQFILGDHLGQHTIGGFMESFTIEYFCRFCLLTRPEWLEDRNQDEPIFRKARWRKPKHYQRALQKKGNEYSYKGIKRQTVFDKLKLNICDPSLPSCIGHDLFIGGVVDHDLSSMIKYFVKTKRWFSYKLLNQRRKAFKCKLNDIGNKPAFLNGKKKKLGGHAVQNWTLLRILPFLIGEEIDPSDPIWQLYLLLKRICELICAPALFRVQISKLREMLDKYMKLRKPLKNNYKPKHHYFQHLADLWDFFGPMIHMWTLGFEHYHQFFKRVGRNCNNFINLIYTFAHKHQLKEAYHSTGILFPSEAVYDYASPLVPESYSPSFKEALQNFNFTSGACVVKTLKYNGVCYKAGQHLLLKTVDSESVINVGFIELIVYDVNKCYFLVTEYKSVLCENYGLYKIKKRGTNMSYILPLANLENPCPHPVYQFKGKTCFSLKNALLSSQV